MCVLHSVILVAICWCAGIKVRVYCQVGKENQGKFALDVAVKTLDFYKKYVALAVHCIKSSYSFAEVFFCALQYYVFLGYYLLGCFGNVCIYPIFYSLFKVVKVLC